MNDEHIKEIVRKMNLKPIVLEWLEDVVTEFDNYVTPEEFGAKGDGVTDDYDAVDKACKAAATERKPVYLGKRYNLGSQLTIPPYVIVTGSTIAPTSISNQKVNTWNLASTYPVIVQHHTTVRNVGFNQTTLKTTGSRNQIESCVFNDCQTAINFHNGNVIEKNGVQTTGWVGEVYVRDCYFYDCIQGILNDSEIEGAACVIDSEISGCTMVNDKKLYDETKNPNPINNDVFLVGRFTAVRLMDSHVYTSKVIANGDILKDLAISNNYFDSLFQFFNAKIDGMVNITNNTFFNSGFDPTWDEESEYHVNEFEKVTGGLFKRLIFTGNTFIPAHMSSEDREKMLANYVFVYTKGLTSDNLPTSMYLQFFNNSCPFKAVKGNDPRQERALLTSFDRCTITYNNQTLTVIRSAIGLAVSGSLNMPPTYGASSDVYGTHTIPSTEGTNYNARFYAVLEYSYDSEDTTKKKTAVIRVTVLANGGIAIEKAPTDYVSGGKLFVNTVLTDYQLNPDNMQI